MPNAKTVALWIGIPLVLLMLTCGGLLFVGMRWISGQIEEQPFVRDAIAAAQVDPEAIAALGEPIESAWGQQQLTLSTGNEQSGEIQLTLAGPNGRGRLHAKGSRASDGDPWVYEYIELRLNDSDQVIDLSD